MTISSNARIASAFADAIDGAFHLACAVVNGRQRIGHRQTQIVMAMDTDDRLARLKLRHGIVRAA